MVYYGLGSLSGDLMMLLMLMGMVMIIMIFPGPWSAWFTVGLASTWAVCQGTGC